MSIYQKILFTRIYLGEKCKRAVFQIFSFYKINKIRYFWLLKFNGTIKMESRK